MSNSRATVRERLSDLTRIRILTRDDLHEAGLTTHYITAGVREGRLVRLRRGVYVAEDVPAHIADAVRAGGRLACLTLLQLIGVFVLEQPGLHVQMPPHLSRSRHRRPDSAKLHWEECRGDETRHAVSIRDAVRQSIRCQQPRAAIATLDSILHHRLLTPAQLAAIFRTLPARFQALLSLVDGSAESGPESFMRLLLRAMGLAYETQVTVPGVGRVDFVVEGWLIIECDSREFHEGWDKQVDDRHRDLVAAGLGYVTVRPLASDIFFHPDTVKAALGAVIDAFGARLGVS
ncbi:type IV toxin-antitoxin system AbiEi family antitoxin domain-containing protein [Microbacterium sp. ARD32]|uniref:type IV toxin-antitoxin system AbiEi family antitoxin domain-containing protein n=1 Tax=Microbacterium sp. ARD32 TaxID=2962577 RepID=UPI0028827A23|nr:type IV toxin-antitoxin system AbiEi family antitoxin domain-containing protein [Microbacterium sp. ARD32]MDT0157756.1 type IV toxin-antitoxin system AbiEi family antitoxin domain-containing protein [Microbacterium sp. ARD32]